MEITLEQALQNIQMVLDMFKGTKQEHIALDQSMSIIKENLCTCKTVKQD